MADGMSKKGSGQFGLSKEIGGSPNPAGTTGTKPGSGGSGGGREGGMMTDKGSGQFTVDRSVKSPPTRKPSK